MYKEDRVKEVQVNSNIWQVFAGDHFGSFGRQLLFGLKTERNAIAFLVSFVSGDQLK